MNVIKKSRISFSALAFLVVGLGVFMYTVYFQEEQLPVFNPTDFNPELVDGSLQAVSENHTVSDFELINQNGATITQADYENKVYVADFFFTRCPSICPIMTNNMEKLQQKFSEDEVVMLLSMSVTPELDSIPVLKEYADKYGAIASKWNITTGDKKHIYNLARQSYFAVVDEGDGGLQDFIHTPNFILVDRKKQIRGVYDGTKDQEIDRLIGDIEVLKRK
ncbi:SCO family protein [Aggregatimonas sangjinii]|uniref:SCO family protein n=1 Tax=Aggregatimonas sangjinii TaxID=2583587 RepID=A0A5B7SLJ3_9FLAO|nr:SCO family protein [Aggregatimonas sangjinii]QCW98941.1 SCO family protein [Aggregatimonas sangjinii]